MWAECYENLWMKSHMNAWHMTTERCWAFGLVVLHAFLYNTFMWQTFLRYQPFTPASETEEQARQRRFWSSCCCFRIREHDSRPVREQTRSSSTCALKKVNSDVRGISGRWPKVEWVVREGFFAFLLSRSLKSHDVLEEAFSED